LMQSFAASWIAFVSRPVVNCWWWNWKASEPRCWVWVANVEDFDDLARPPVQDVLMNRQVKITYHVIETIKMQLLCWQITKSLKILRIIQVKCSGSRILIAFTRLRERKALSKVLSEASHHKAYQARDFIYHQWYDKYYYKNSSQIALHSFFIDNVVLERSPRQRICYTTESNFTNIQVNSQLISNIEGTERNRNKKGEGKTKDMHQSSDW